MKLKIKHFVNHVMDMQYTCMVGKKEDIHNWFKKRDVEPFPSLYNSDAFFVMLERDNLSIFLVAFIYDICCDYNDAKLTGLIAHEALHTVHHMYSYMNGKGNAMKINKHNTEFICRALGGMVEQMFSFVATSLGKTKVVETAEEKLEETKVVETAEEKKVEHESTV